jgi:predicted outer membrane repeat protein
MKTRTRKNRLLSILLSFALVVTLFAGLGITASATSVWDGVYPPVDLTTDFGGGTGTQADPYIIGNATDFAQLAVNVNSGSTSTTAYSGKYFQLTDDIDLDNNPWTPIGGASPLSGGVPTGSYFGGIFDGYYATGTYNTHTISNLNVTASATAANNSGYGLFGYVNGGIIENLSINGGSVNMGTSNISEVGGFVGYTNGTIFNLHNLGTTVSVNNAGASQAGGVAGTVENAVANTTIYVLYCSNEAAVTGRGRVGGIVGAVYNASAVGTVVDLCFNRGNLTTVGTTQKSYTGGIVGYCRGYIADSYSFGVTLATSGGHYIAGLVGIIQGVSPAGALYNSYADSKFDGANANYDRFLFASVDSSNTMVINNSLWVPSDSQITQPDATGTNGWGNWTQVGAFTSTTATSVWTTSSGTTTTPAALTVLNAPGSFILADGKTVYYVGSTTATGDPYDEDGTTNDGYPFLVWEQTPSIIPRYAPDTPTPAPTDNDPDNAIFLDGSVTTPNPDGSKAYPFNTFADAATAAQTWTGTKAIYVRGLVTVSAVASWTLPTGFTLYRSSIYDGYLFDITGGTVSLNAITVDGNRTNTAANFPSGTLALFEVNGGTLEVGENVIIQNNVSRVGGGAIEVISGTALISGGSVNNNTGADGGALHVQANGTASMKGGALQYNTAYHGGAVYVEYSSTPLSGGIFEMSGGSVINNTARNSGGGVETRGTFTLSGNGTITGNTAADGGGVGVLAISATQYGTFTMSGGTISRNTATATTTEAKGGGLYVATGGQATLNGGTIIGNTAVNGGGVFIDSLQTSTPPVAGVFTITGGTITNNVSTGNGGGVYVTAAGTLNINGGTISSNATTGNGPGVYADWTTGNTYPIVISPAGSAVITVSDIVYLNGDTSSADGARIDLTVTLSSANITTPLLIKVANPGEERNTVRAVDNAGATASVAYTKRWTGDPMSVGTGRFILYNGTTL